MPAGAEEGESRSGPSQVEIWGVLSGLFEGQSRSEVKRDKVKIFVSFQRDSQRSQNENGRSLKLAPLLAPALQAGCPISGHHAALQLLLPRGACHKVISSPTASGL